MANRKVLINRHTSGSSAPQADSMYLGELAVAHETGKETLFTKNNAGNMVPFISCAQTISIVSGMIESVDVVYNVEKKSGEPYINVETGGTDHQKIFTLSTSGVQSEEEFKAYSARTNEALTALTDAFNALLDITVTGISGDTIIVAEQVPNGTGSNSYNLTHKQALATSGFNKLTTDAYGHVTASAAVTTEDIQALGFKTSAQTGEDLEALSASVVTNKANIEALSAGTLQLSADTVHYVDDQIDEVYASAVSYTNAAIDALDSSVSAATGKYFTALAIEDGKLVAKEEASIPVLEVESAGTGNVVASITVADHKISYQTASVATSEGIAALSASVINLSAVTGEFSGATDSRINDLSGYTEAVDDKVEKLSAATISISGFAHGEIAQLSAATSAVSVDVENLSAATLALSAVTLTGVSLNNTPLTVTDHVVSVPVTVSGSGIANATESGSVADAIAVKEYVENLISSAVEYKGATGATPASATKGDLYIASADFTLPGGANVETGDFIIYDGTKWDVVEKNLDGAITGNLTQDTVVLGDSTNSVKSLANGASGQVLTMAGGAPAWVDDPELSVVSAGTGNVVSDITVSDHEITFTKGVTAADDADLQALSGVVTEFSATTNTKFTELSAYTKDVDDKVKALSAGTIQLSADTKAAIEQLSGFAHNSMIARDDAVFSSAKTYTDEKVAAEIALLDSVGSASTTGHYLTSVTITDGKISAVGEVAVPAAVAITATTGAAVDTPSAVLTGVTADGTDNHNLTFGMSNKVFSATTADSALTSESALTSVSATVAADAVHASAATKVDSALTLTDVAGTNSVVFDGSANRTVTFGTATSVSGQNSMSMDANGVVDVDIIDCGEY